MEGSKMREKLADRLVPALLAIGAVLTAIDVVWTFTVAPLVQGARLSEPAIIAGQVVTTKLLLSQKIFYLHVPVAVASFAAMAVAAFFAARFLATKDRAHDRASRTAMQVTLVFIIATMISGDVWTRFEWGVWWVWEPRLTTYFILMLLVIGYFILRNALDDPERSARFGAVFCIIAFIDAPISFFITRLVPSSVHPVVFRTDSGLPPAMLIPFLLGLFGMCMIAFALYRYALRVNTAADEVEELKERLEELDASAQRAAADEALERLQAQAAALPTALPTPLPTPLPTLPLTPPPTRATCRSPRPRRIKWIRFSPRSIRPCCPPPLTCSLRMWASCSPCSPSSSPFGVSPSAPRPISTPSSAPSRIVSAARVSSRAWPTRAGVNGAAAREAMNDLPPRKGAYEPFVHKLLFCTRIYLRK